MKSKASKIKANIDQLIVDYVETKISTADLAQKMTEFDNPKTVNLLQEAGMDKLASLIDVFTDVTYYLSNDHFNHHDKGNVLTVIDNYYKTINKEELLI